MRDDGGFDAVIGNPPYANAIEVNTARTEQELNFYSARHLSARGAFDLYVLFQELGTILAKPRSWTAMIVPNKWLAADYGRALRNELVTHHSIVRLADYSSVGVFGDAAVYPVVYVVHTHGGITNIV